MERIEVEPENRKRMRMRIPAPPRSGEIVMTLAGVGKSYEAKTVYRDLDFQLRRGERVALAGPNGAGKSTLLRLVAGVLDFESGSRTPGHNVQVAFYAQHQLESLDASRTVLEELGSAGRTSDVPRLRGHLGAFLFTGDDVEKRVGVLSGGEKARLALAKMLLHPANLLVLDEPTNHLDIAACEVLEEALSEYRGTFVFVSHDRSFINALATRVVEVKAGQLRDFPGNYDDYLRKLAELDAKARALEPPPEPEARPASVPKVEPQSPQPERESHQGVRESLQLERESLQPERESRQLERESRQLERERKKAREKLGRRIRRLEEEIQSAEGELEALGWKLGDPDLYKDVERLRALTESRQTAESGVAAMYAEWERLSDELAALDDGGRAD
jgi:ATP-binding cassette subfamily F protein 3